METNIFGYAGFSLVESKIYGQIVSCYGIESCMSAIMIDITSVVGIGACSLRNAVIQSGNNDMNVVLSGYYSGYNLTIICQNGVTCTIDCSGNACFSTYLDCENGNCIINCDELQSIDCPKNITNYQQTDNFEDNTPQLIDFFRLSNMTEQNCNNVGSSIAFDDYQDSDASANPSNNGTICCRGTQSCQNSITLTVDRLNHDIICNSQEACKTTGVLQTASDGNGSIFCDGAYACQNAVIKGSNDGIISCGGIFSCFGADMFGAKSVYCSGGSSCFVVTMYGISDIYLLSDGNDATNIYSNGTGVVNISLLSFQSGDGVDIYCDHVNDTCNIFCYTNQACNNDSLLINCTIGQCNIFCDEINGIQCGNYIGNVIVYSWSTMTPTFQPTVEPTLNPTQIPTHPTTQPSIVPTVTVPTRLPTFPNTTVLTITEFDSSVLFLDFNFIICLQLLHTWFCLFLLVFVHNYKSVNFNLFDNLYLYSYKCR